MTDKPVTLKGPLHSFEWHALIQCPGCGFKAWIDREQFEGSVSIECRRHGCDYHETHDLREREEA